MYGIYVQYECDINTYRKSKKKLFFAAFISFLCIVNCKEINNKKKKQQRNFFERKKGGIQKNKKKKKNLTEKYVRQTCMRNSLQEDVNFKLWFNVSI